MIYRVDPLSAEGTDNGDMSPALQLFSERVAGYGGTVPAGGSEAAAAQSIVSRLDGIPLAIELVAARTRIVGMTERAKVLGGRLTAGPTDGGGFRVTAVLPLTPQDDLAPPSCPTRPGAVAR